MNNRRYLMMFLVLAFVFVLAACSGGGKNDPATGGNATNNEAGEKQTEQPVNGNKESPPDDKKPAEVVEIKWFRQEVGASRNKEFFKKIEDKFHEQNPDIKVIGIANNSNLTVTEFLKTSLASGDMPDVMTMMTVDEFADAGALLEIPDDIANLLADPDFGRKDGKLYTVPYKTDVIGVFYNKDLFEQWGVEVPKTWAEFVAIIEKSKENKTTPLSISGKDSWVLGMGGLWPLIGAEALEKNPEFPTQRAQGEVDFTDPVFASAMQKFSDLNTMGAFGKGVLGINYQQATEQFTSGKAAMYMNGSWVAGSDFPNLQPGFDVGFFPLPSETAVKGYMAKGTEGWSVSSTTEHPEAALKFLKFLFEDEEVYASLIETEAAFSTTAKQIMYPVNEYGQAVLDGIEGYEPYPLPGFGLGESAWAPGIDSFIFKILQNVVSGSDIQKEIADANKEWQRLIN
ncbi:ABC transporter substrate-binding protein [Paenibacillus yanchengensis]|uniref:ABC transporter substrate-binding protein n=1 Tax=Paenibacillus yanchengensis TaxID=2035833 RepID=A0ABW4YPH9_9BACL